MSHLRGFRAQRYVAPRNHQQPEPQDFADTEQSDELPELAGWDWPGDSYHHMPGIPAHPRKEES